MDLGFIAEEMLLSLHCSEFKRMSTIGSTALSYQAIVHGEAGAKWKGQEAMDAVGQIRKAGLIDVLNDAGSDSVCALNDEGRNYAEMLHPDVIIFGNSVVTANIICRKCRSTIFSDLRTFDIIASRGESALRETIDEIAAKHKPLCTARDTT